MLVLGIESSCDETGIALYNKENETLLAHKLFSQIKLHAEYGGVVPELASRDHITRIIPLIKDTLAEASKSIKDIDVIAVTSGPGLGGALLVGMSVAYGLSYALDKPIIEVHHLEGHILSPFLSEPNLKFPYLTLLVSGGHTQILEVNEIGEYNLLGQSIDDASGEAFDKVGKLLGLEYPAGAMLSKLASCSKTSPYKFPRPMINSKDLNMSFAGLKTAVLTLVLKLEKEYPQGIPDYIRNNICFSFQEAVIDVLTAKIKLAILQTRATRLAVVGGVGANLALHDNLKKLPIEVFFPKLEWCTDNGAMIAYAGSMRLDNAKKILEFDAKPRWKLFA